MIAKGFFLEYTKPCKCGCGENVVWKKLKNRLNKEITRSYVVGHENRFFKHTEETKRRISKSMMGKQNFLGQKRPESVKIKISNSLKGRKFSAETLKKIGEANKKSLLGKKQSPETIEKRKISLKKWRESDAGKKHILKRFGGENSAHPKHCKWYQVDGINCQGTYERDFVKKCHEIGLYPVRSSHIDLKDDMGSFIYIPDFVLNGSYIEIKGYCFPKTIRNIKACIKNNIKISILKQVHIEQFLRTGCLTTLTTNDLINNLSKNEIKNFNKQYGEFIKL